MSKNLKSSFVLFVIAFSIIIAWNTLLSFFGGVGVAFVALLILTGILIFLNVTDKEVFNRTKDLFIALCVFDILEFTVYFIFEFQVGSYKTLSAFYVFQSILALFAILLLGYLTFRFVCEHNGKKFQFIEIMLGNVKVGSKVKKAREISNGSLEEKPIVNNPQSSLEDEQKSTSENTNQPTGEQINEPTVENFEE